LYQPPWVSNMIDCLHALGPTVAQILLQSRPNVVFEV
jgi:hypothetical protein